MTKDEMKDKISFALKDPVLQQAFEIIFKENAELREKTVRQKWHKVADEDLPKHEVNVLVLYNVQCIDIAHYNNDYKEWHFRDSIVRDVIAWCELPKFEE